MKKTGTIAALLLGLAAILALAFTGTAYWFGVKTERQFQASLKQLPPTPFFKATMPIYKRGIFKSHAVTNFEITQVEPGRKAGEKTLRFSVIHDIWHGPFSLEVLPDGKRHWQPMLAFVRSRLSFVPADSDRPELKEIAPSLTLTAFTTVSLSGASQAEFTMPPLDKTLGQKEKQVTVHWKGMQGHAQLGADLKRIDGSLEIPGLEANDKNGAFKMGKITATVNAYPGPTGLSLGDFSFRLAQMGFHEPEGKKSFALQNLTAATSTREKNGLISSAQSIRLDKIALARNSFGPFQLDLDLRNFDAATLLKFQEAMQKIQQQAMQQPNHTDLNPAMFGDLAPLLPQFLQKSPEIELKELSLKTRDGMARARALVAFHATAGVNYSNPLMLLTALQVEADATISEHLLAKTFKAIIRDKIRNALKQQGQSLPDTELDRQAAEESRKQLEILAMRDFLVRKDGKFSISLRYEQGNITVNGNPIPLQGLLPMGRM